MEEPAWRFLSALCAARPLDDAIKATRGIEMSGALAEHLVAGRFVGFASSDRACTVHPLEVTP
ncbi:hypothetical protein [Dongia deserti]|uniref:hypothetical protein n=1 Tax=Dongia deserti TaxID=2268030 RepID=UPI0013C53896|nr:hypothetical protein [Dongia deserti]